MSGKTTDYLELLDDFQDYLATGYRRDRQTVKTSEVSPTPKTGDDRASMLARLEAEVRNCTRCPLAATRTFPVPGEGALDPLVMLIGEGPGGDEDRTGRPFVGRAGQYLDKWLASVNLDRQRDCFIGNVVKCRPPGNRDPLPEESALCIPFLERQIDIIRPKVILTLGRISGRLLADSAGSLGSLRGKTWSYRGIPLIATYHPSGVLRNPEYRRPVWDDLRRLRLILDGLQDKGIATDVS